MNFDLTEEEQALAELVKKFVDTRVDPKIREIDENNVIPEELLDVSTRYLINPTGRFVIGGPEGDFGGQIAGKVGAFEE